MELLILLVERPIKVGDWVIVGDREGVVKRISVRATELQTFQRASVIIPNSELVSKAVLVPFIPLIVDVLFSGGIKFNKPLL